MRNTTIELKPVTKNEITVTPVVAKIKRGPAKDTQFPYFKVTEENLQDWIKFRGAKTVAKRANAMEMQEGQSALDYAAEWDEKTTIDPETSKETKIFNLISVDSDKYWTAYVSDTLRGGQKISDLVEDSEELNEEFKSLFAEMVKPDTSAQRKLECQTLMTSLYQEIQNIDQAIKDRRRERKTKAPATATPATT